MPTPPVSDSSGRLEQVFLDAVDEPAGPARDARLRDACGGDAALLDDARRLLNAHEANADGRFDRLAVAPGAAAHPHGEEVPATIGGYDVVRYVDGGSIGTVYEARHAATGRRAAVKLIRVGLATARQRARFAVEAELLAKLSDPGIARLYDAGEAAVTYADGQRARRVFIAMEFVDGPDVVAHCRTLGLPLAGRVGLMIAAARAVQHAHERGVVHRDLKPGHVIVARGDGRPRVVDFGIATVTDPDARMTLTGTVMGTPAYMSPEQRAGRRDLIGPPTDVYSLAAVCYEMLAGRPAVESDAMAFGDHAPPEPRRLRSVAADVPRDLDAVIHKALSTHPADRYPTARDLADDLQRWADLLPVRARPPSAWDRAKLQARRRPRLVTAASVAVVAGVTLGSVAGWQAVRARRAERAVRAELVTVDREKARADHAAKVSAAVARFLSDEIIGRADTGKQLGDAAGATPALTLREAIDRAATHLTDDAFEGDADIEVAVRRAVADAYASLGEYGKAVTQYHRARAVLRRTRGADAEPTLELEATMSESLMNANRPAEAAALLRHVYAVDGATAGPTATATVLALDRLVKAIMLADGPTDEEVRLLRTSIDRSRQSFGPTNGWTVMQMRYLAFVLTTRGERGEAARVRRELIPAAEAAVARSAREAGPDAPDTLTLEALLGQTDADLGQYDRGLPLLRDVVARRTRLLGPDHADTVDAVTRLAAALDQAKRYDEALALAEAAVAHQLGLHGPDHIDTLASQAWQARVLSDQGRFGDAERILRDVVDRAGQLHFQSVYPRWAYLNALNQCLLKQGKPPYRLATTTAATRAAR